MNNSYVTGNPETLPPLPTSIIVFLKMLLLFFMWMGVLPVGMALYYMSAWYRQRPEQGFGSPGTVDKVVMSCPVGTGN